MKKALISTSIIIVILAAIFVSLFLIPQFIGRHYIIETMPAKLEYRLVNAVGEDGKPYQKLDSKWEVDGLVVVKINKMGQKNVVQSKDYSVTFPSTISAAGEYTMTVAINNTDITLPITVKVLDAV